ncbi:hypothetical protein pipiens_010309 [Culex pipiens pipiens]|uniref:Uncharacterized protein n=1 Tax=Culex pipiens pipiens TaxID=38569 RepID=A0ABD1DAT4_CULPP
MSSNLLDNPDNDLQKLFQLFVTRKIESLKSPDNVESSSGGHGKIVAWITPLDIPTTGDAIWNVLGITEITTAIGTVVAAFLSVNTMAKQVPPEEHLTQYALRPVLTLGGACRRQDQMGELDLCFHPGTYNIRFPVLDEADMEC